jgi:hypothetical protein
VDDAGAGFPKADAVFLRDALEEVEDLLVGLESDRKVLIGSKTPQQEMVAVNGGGHGRAGNARAHELKEGHLGSGVLHGYPIGAQEKKALPRFQLLALRIVQVAQHHLLHQRQRPAQALAHHRQVLLHPFVDALDEFLGAVDLHAFSRFLVFCRLSE